MLHYALLIAIAIVVGVGTPVLRLSNMESSATESCSTQLSVTCLNSVDEGFLGQSGDGVTLDFEKAELAPATSSIQTRLITSCKAELAAWEHGDIPEDKYWALWNEHLAPWCSEFVGWNLESIGFVVGSTMPGKPACARAYYSFYSEHPELAEIHENDGSYCPRAGDIVLFDGFTHTEMIIDVDDDGTEWNGISGGSKVRRTHRKLSDERCRWFITLLPE